MQHRTKGVFKRELVKKIISTLASLHNNCYFKNRNLKVDHHTKSKWFIHCPKRHRENRLQSLKHSYWMSLIFYVNLIWRRPFVYYPILCSKRMSMDRNILGRWMNVEMLCLLLWLRFACQKQINYSEISSFPKLNEAEIITWVILSRLKYGMYHNTIAFHI